MNQCTLLSVPLPLSLLLLFFNPLYVTVIYAQSRKISWSTSSLSATTSLKQNDAPSSFLKSSSDKEMALWNSPRFVLVYGLDWYCLSLVHCGCSSMCYEFICAAVMPCPTIISLQMSTYSGSYSLPASLILKHRGERVWYRCPIWRWALYSF